MAEENNSSTGKGKFCSLNMRLLPIKSHFFFFYGAIGGVMPFMPILAKELGISATAVGIVFTIVPFCVFFTKPFFGFLTDYFKNIKLIVLTLVIITTLCYILMIFLPSIDNHHWTKVDLRCEGEVLSLLPYGYDSTCLRDTLQNDTICQLKFSDCSRQSVNLRGTTSVRNETNSLVRTVNQTSWLSYLPATNFTSSCMGDESPSIACPKLNPCLSNTTESSVYESYQFWLFTCLAIVSGTGAATVFCLSDAACYEVLGDKPELFGRQRLWATISWGCATFLAGILNDVTPPNCIVSSYAPGFYLMLSLTIVDLIILSNIKLTKANFSINICKDILKILSSFEIAAFAVAVYITGALTGLLWQYQFWFLQDLGASKTLLGLTIAVQCLAAEVPLFFFSGWFIKKFGHFYCVTFSFAAFALRFGYYYALQNPWLVLPVEVLHGVTFAIFYASMTGYASHRAPPGTEATMMGILGGLYEGLGVATGSLLGGLGFDKLGGRKTFLVACGISCFCVPTLIVIHNIIKRVLTTPEGQSSTKQKTSPQQH